jgi:hypothetical protein
VGMAEKQPRRSRPGQLHRRQVVLLAESAGLVVVLSHLLGPDDRLSRVSSLRELAGSPSLDAADVVVLDLPDDDREAAVRQVRRRYRGPLVLLAGGGERPVGPLPDDACTLLARPFSVGDLLATLRGSGRTTTAAAAALAAPIRPPAPARTPGRLDPLVDRTLRLLTALVEGWKTRRQVRVAGFVALVVVAFAVAFALAAKGRCGPGCDPLGTGLRPAPTIASVGLNAPPGTEPRRPASTTIIRAGTPRTGAFLGTSGRRRAVSTTNGSARSAATSTTQRPVTTQPATTQPATTQTTTPPTTAPPTTQQPTTIMPMTAAEAPAPTPTAAG